MTRLSSRLSSRRSLLQGAVMLTAAPIAALGAVPVFDVIGGPEPAAPETTIMRLFREWEALEATAKAAADATEGQGFEAEDRAFAAFTPERHRIEDAIRAEAPTDLRDLAVKVVILSGEGSWGLPNETILECAALAGRDFDKMARCLFERD